MANLAFYRVRVNECPNEKVSLSATYAYGYSFLLENTNVQKHNCIQSIKSNVQ